jgi:hypothetical protein
VGRATASVGNPDEVHACHFGYQRPGQVLVRTQLNAPPL